MRRLSGVPGLVAVLLFAGSAVLFGATLVDAVGVDVSPSGETPRPGVEEPLQGGAREAIEAAWAGPYPRVTANEMLDAVNQDLFQPDRTPPLQRYLLPSERTVPIADSRDQQRRREPQMRVVGTALAGNMRLALIQTADTIPLSFAVGEMVEGYTLAAVDQESATFLSGDEELVLPVVAAEGGAGGGSARGQNAQEADVIRAYQERLQQLQQMLRQGQGRGNGGMGMPGAAIRLAPATIQRLQQMEVPVPSGSPVTSRTRRGGGGGGGDLP